MPCLGRPPRLCGQSLGRPLVRQSPQLRRGHDLRRRVWMSLRPPHLRGHPLVNRGPGRQSDPCRGDHRARFSVFTRLGCSRTNAARITHGFPFEGLPRVPCAQVNHCSATAEFWYDPEEGHVEVAHQDLHAEPRDLVP